MAIEVQVLRDAGEALAGCRGFLEEEPVAHNLILSLLCARAAGGEREGRYGVARSGGDVVGVVFQSPLSFHATLTPMGAGVPEACVDALVAAGAELPGVSGEAAAAARFAGRWAERCRVAARPVQAQRIHEATDVTVPTEVGGRLRRATDRDGATLTDWWAAFAEETGEPGGDVGPVVAERTSAGELWVWEDPIPVSMAAASPPAAMTVRIGPVYTPSPSRGRGYASAAVGSLTRRALDRGQRCILYTDLANPTSNAIYRRLGYRPVQEVVRYRFG